MKEAQLLQEKEAENALLRAEISSHKQALLQKEQALSQQNQTITALEAHVLRMQARIAWFERQQFGYKSEKFRVEDPNQLCLDFDLRQEQPEPQAPPELQKISYTRKKKHPGRKALPEELPRKEIVIEPENKTGDMVRLASRFPKMAG